MNTGLGTLLTAQSQQTQKLEQAQVATRLKQQQEVKIQDSPAVEIRLSPQAKALMQALAERGAALAGKDEQTKAELIDAAEAFINKNQAGAIKRPAVSVALDHLLAQYGTPYYSPENQEELDRLFLQLKQELDPIRRSNKTQANQIEAANLNPVVTADTAYRSSLTASVENMGEDTLEATDTGSSGYGAYDEQPVFEGSDGLTQMERIKSAILYSELDRILGGVGVYFGGDQVISQLDNAIQDRVSEAKRDLTKIITGVENGVGLTPGLTPTLTPGQEARIDEIYRQITSIQDQAEDRNVAERKQAIRNLIENNSSYSLVIEAGNASLGG